MTKTKRILSLAMALLLALNLFAVAVSASDLADYSALTNYINTCVPTDNDAGIYSEESMYALEQTLGSINYELTSADQAIVDGYLTAVKEAVAALQADESKAAASYGISASKTVVHPGDVIDVYVNMDANYRVVAASAAVLFDKSLFTIVAEPGSSATSYLDCTGALSTYTIVGNWKSPASLYSRNSNPEYWQAQMDSIGVAYMGWSGDSTKGDPVMPTGRVAKFSLKVNEDAQVGDSGTIFMNSDWIKTASSKGGLVFVSRAIGTKFGGGANGAVTYGQTIDLSNATATVTVGHIPGEWIIDKQPTCTEPGSKHSVCAECGETIENVEMEALGHTWGDWVITDSTCTTEGTKTRTCAVCSAEETESISMKEHTPGEWEIITPATCTTAGEQVKKCIACGEVVEREVIAALEHNYETVVTAPTCTEDGYTTHTCANCGDSYVTDPVEALGHTWGEWTVSQPVTATEKGIEERECSVCHEKETREIAVPNFIPTLNLIRCTAAQSGNVITITSTPNAGNLTINVKTKEGKELVIDTTGTGITQTSDKTRYVLSALKCPEGGVETTMTIDGIEYILKIVFVHIDLVPSEVRTIRVQKVEVDNEAKTVTLTSNVGANYVVMYSIGSTSGAFNYVIPEGAQVDKYTSVRYMITQNGKEEQFTTSMTVNGEAYTLIVNFIPMPYNPGLYMTPIYGGIEMKTIDDAESILISRRDGKPYVGIKTAGLSGATLDIEITDQMNAPVNGIIRVYEPEDGTDVVTKITITYADGSVESYPLIFRFAPAEFSAEVLKTVNIGEVVYDAEAGTMDLTATTDTLIRIYKNTTNGLDVTIDTEAYPFITETSVSYEIQRNSLAFADKGMTNFVITTSDGKTINTALKFQTNGVYDMRNFITANCSSKTADENDVFTFAITAGKSSMKLNDTLSTGEKLVLNCDNAAVTYDAAAGEYTIRTGAVGKEASIVISGIEYTVQFVRGV